jgi:hypothetical protein
MREAGLRPADRLRRRRPGDHQLRRGRAVAEDRRPARYVAGRRRLARLKAAMMHEGVRRWLRKVAPRTRRYGLGLHRRRSCSPRPACSTASVWRRTGRAAPVCRALSRRLGRRRGALCRRRQGLDLGRRHYRHRHGAGAGRGRSRRGGRQPDRPPLRAAMPAGPATSRSSARCCRRRPPPTRRSPR